MPRQRALRRARFVSMLVSYSGFIMRKRRGAVVIIAPLSRTVFESLDDVRASCTIVWTRA
jgi:hypothetical protein